jgi:GNAT superfamily N-acetyltransferase
MRAKSMHVPCRAGQTMNCDDPLVTIRYSDSPPLGNEALNALFAAAWPGHAGGDFQAVLARSLGFVAALDGERLVGFVNVAWDGGVHAFVLDTTVHPAYQRRGIGKGLVREATRLARAKGAQWLHVDFEPHLADFYLSACGFRPSAAGVLRL